MTITTGGYSTQALSSISHGIPPTGASGSVASVQLAAGPNGELWFLAVYTGTAAPEQPQTVAYSVGGLNGAPGFFFGVPNTTTLQSVSLGGLASGLPVVAWESGNAVYFTLFPGQYGGGAAPVTVATGVTASASSDASIRTAPLKLDVVGLTDGGFAIGYENGSGAPALAFYGADGTARSTAALSTSSTPVTQFSMAALKGGGLVEVFSDLSIYPETARGPLIYHEQLEYRVFSNSGTLVSSGQLLVEKPTDHEYNATVVALNDGGFAVGYNAYSSDFGDYAQVRTYDSSGAARGSVQTISPVANSGPTWNTNLYLLANGDVAATPYASNATSSTVATSLITPAGTSDGSFSGPLSAVRLTNGLFATEQSNGTVNPYTVTLSTLSQSATGDSSTDAYAGTAFNDVINGAGGNDQLHGGAGNDTITGGPGDDLVDGGPGSDTAVFTSMASYYSLARDTTGGIVVTGPDGTDTLTGIETLKFSDQTVRGVVPLTPRDDFGGDLNADILWREAGGAVRLWSMSGATALADQAVSTISTAWRIAAVSDFSGDGRSDLIWRDTSGDVRLWSMEGPLALTDSSLATGVGANWKIEAVGHFGTFENTAELLWRSTSGELHEWSSISVYGEGHADTTLATVPTDWSIVGVADFDNDGKDDLVWRGPNGEVRLWEMNGTGVKADLGVGVIPLNWTILGVGDFGGDGRADILWESSAGEVRVWDMSGNQELNDRQLAAGISANWHVVEIADFNGDGRSDILWRSDAGELHLWTLGAAGVASDTGLGTIPTNWTVDSQIHDLWM